LVEISRTLVIEQAGSAITKPFCLDHGCVVLGKDTQEHTLHVAVNDCDRLAKGNAGDGRGSVLSYAGQPA
jgi:hypothetical protein